jgi:hypothetical protein
MNIWLSFVRVALEHIMDPANPQVSRFNCKWPFEHGRGLLLLPQTISGHMVELCVGFLTRASKSRASKSRLVLDGL